MARERGRGRREQDLNDVHSAESTPGKATNVIPADEMTH